MDADDALVLAEVDGFLRDGDATAPSSSELEHAKTVSSSTPGTVGAVKSKKSGIVIA